MITDKGEGTTSYLLIQDAELTDSGKYSCAPYNADMASIRVHVLNGKRVTTTTNGHGWAGALVVEVVVVAS